MRPRSVVLAFLLCLVAAPAVCAAEPPVIAPTDALSATDERKAFIVPPGFDVQLVASEPDIKKPIQMAFDAKGRLWVTTSRHYPFAADPKDAGTDKLFILSDFDPASGKARKVEIFAEDLNIPIGILPLPDCRSCIVSSVGEIRKYTDTKGTGKADKKEVLFSGFGVRDTHGMNNSYTYMPDGWVYACHGFLNTSRLKGKDGHEVEMNSGNTFRFRPDGSRIEVFTRGQVNPFGIAIDPWFNLYTADCHSKPITQLIPGGYYDSFGKPHDGLGYAPHVVHHDHGSTALCGLTWYDANHFPKEYWGTMFLGNVVTNRINFDRIEWKGATPVGIEQPDFLVSKDPWFRPVDIKLGPDGALYVSDFYNKIIGHYEVDLKHPLRDKDRGRIWRIIWKGKDGSVPPPKLHRDDFTAASDEDLLKDLVDPNLTVRFLAGHQLRRRVAEGKEIGGSAPTDDRERMTSVAGWAAFIQEASKKGVPLSGYVEVVDIAKQVFAKDPQALGGQVVRALSSRKTFGDGERKLLLDIFQTFAVPHVRIACVEAVIFHPHADFVKPLIEVIKKCPAYDTHLRQAARIALRNCLRDDGEHWLLVARLKERQADLVPLFADVASAIPNLNAARFLSSSMPLAVFPSDRIATAAEHVAKYGEAEERRSVLSWLTRSHSFSAIKGEGLLKYLRALQSRGIREDEYLSREVLTLMEGMIQDHFSAKEPFATEEVARLLSLMRVLTSLPSIVTSWDGKQLPADAIESLGAMVKDSKCPDELKMAVCEAMLKAIPQASVPMVRLIYANPALPTALRERLLILLASSSNKDARLDTRDALKDAPYRLALTIGTALAGTPAGAEELLDAVKQGKAPARLLQERIIVERLKAARLPDLDKRLAELTKGLTAPDQRLAELMKVRTTRYPAAKTDKEIGAKLFAKHCGACHRVADQGGKIAPQLDGIGTRGLERLLEDVLDPNRNVDQAFRARVITTADGRTITGLMLRVEGEVLLLADSEGKELRIPTKDIETNRETMLSPMPANFGDAIPEADFYNLMAFLLDQKAKESPKK